MNFFKQKNFSLNFWGTSLIRIYSLFSVITGPQFPLPFLFILSASGKLSMILRIIIPWLSHHLSIYDLVTTRLLHGLPSVPVAILYPVAILIYAVSMLCGDHNSVVIVGFLSSDIFHWLS